jgi:3-oxoadipate enol-lactonase
MSTTACRVLLLHSIGLDGAAYDILRRALPEGIDFTAIDQRGHGAKAADSGFGLADLVDDTLAAIERLGAEPVHLVGHSLGGAVAALAAARVPRRVASLALIATPPASVPAFAERAVAAERDGVASTVAPTLQRWFDGDDGDTAPVAELGRRGFARMSHAGLASAWRSLAAFDGYAALPALPRALCIAGAADVSTPAAAMQRIVDVRREVQPGADIRLETVARAGHMVPLTHPHDVAALLTAHWRRADHGPDDNDNDTDRRPS